MNRELLIIICDFLLISLLSLARFEDQPTIMADEPGPTQGAVEAQGAHDMLEVLQLALEQERASRVEMSRELDKARENLMENSSSLEERQAQVSKLRDALESAEDRAQSIKREHSQLASHYQTTVKSVEFLQEQYVSTKEDAKELRADLSAKSEVAAVSQAKLDAIQSELITRRNEAEQLRNKIERLEDERRRNEAQKFKLALDLRQSQTEAIVVKEQLAVAHDSVATARADIEFARTEVDHARKQVSEAFEEREFARREVESARDEKKRIEEHAERLAEGVSTLAERSAEIKEEIRQNTPLTPNAIFADFIANRVLSRFFASRSGRFGQNITRETVSNTIFVRDGERIFALFHIDDTPLTLWQGESDWQQLTGSVRRGDKSYGVSQMAFIDLDPRLIVVPVGVVQARNLEAKAYPIADNPLKFSRAVLVGAKDDYYGEAEFKVDTGNPNYVRMERQAFSKLFGKFSPSRGDLVFSLTGDLLGIMVNNEFCALLRRIDPTREVRFGMNIADEQTGQVVAFMRSLLTDLPIKLQ